VDNPHADGSLAALFRPVHYEGRAEATHFWQSSAGSDAAELKFGLVPLIFGTIKATLYAMVFAVPLAILAAIYSSEFMQPRVRSIVKPVVELMAGLPSVVLGFIAALVLAPFVENVIPAVLLIFIAVPVGVMVFGFVWQLLPPRLAQGVPTWLPFTLMLGAVLLMVTVAFLLGPVMERLLFYGDFRAWVDSRVGTGRLGATPGWILLLTPLAAVALVMGFNFGLRHRIPLFDGRRRSRIQLAVADLVRFLATGLMAIALAALMGAALSAVGLDLRGGIFDTYVQRNALNVGIIMGFAIIPIIYTVSEDALSSVPNTLRSAAYGAGATPWQTAVRVVLPVAASGIFSACMIGFGRAAGETMIVLMAAGNTPVLEWNIFSGLRTLSANIAVELPEAAVGSTHYRVLYLSALVLFAITFLVNTTAEVVRIRFRRRAFQL
jgi:phosphate transport system permease protein